VAALFSNVTEMHRGPLTHALHSTAVACDLYTSCTLVPCSCCLLHLALRGASLSDLRIVAVLHMVAPHTCCSREHYVAWTILLLCVFECGVIARWCEKTTNALVDCVASTGCRAALLYAHFSCVHSLPRVQCYRAHGIGRNIMPCMGLTMGVTACADTISRCEVLCCRPCA
jgi:hypothetical protein